MEILNKTKNESSLNRVAMIIQSYFPHVGGAERQLANVGRRLTSMGVEVRIYTRQLPNTALIETIDGIEVNRIPTPGPKALASLGFTLRTLRLLHRFQPQIIHAHDLLSPTTTAVFAKRLMGTPVVSKVLRGGKLGDLTKLQSRFMGSQRLKGFQRDVDAFIAISKEIDDELAAIGIHQDKRQCIPNGVDTKRFSNLPTAERIKLRARLKISEGPLVTYVGRLVPEKRVDQLIDIWPAVRKANQDAILLILGEGPERSRLEKQAGAGVLLSGNIEDVVPYLQVTDIFVLPSETEGLSNSLLEAMSVGLPVIATEVGGAPDLIEHGTNGYLVPPNSPETLGKAIISLINDKKLQARMGMQAREKMIQGYDLDSTADQIFELYHRLTKSTAKNRH